MGLKILLNTLMERVLISSMPVVKSSKTIIPEDVTLNNMQSLGNIEPLEILGNIPPNEQPLGNIQPLNGVDPLGTPPANLPLQDPYLQMNAVEPKQSESVINTKEPDSILSESVNKNRNDPHRTIHLKDNPVEPKINKTTKGIGGDRDSIDVLKNEGDLSQERIQKTLLDADIHEKPNEFPLKEEKLDNHNNGSRQDGSEQSTQNEEPYPAQGVDTTNGEKPIQDMKDTANQWSETHDSKKGYFNPYKPTREKKETQKPLSTIAKQYRQNLSRIDTPLFPNRQPQPTREITQKSTPPNAFSHGKSTTLRRGNTSVSF